ncbi:MAG: hypothetical protein ACTS3T_20805 [Almyronema sp.]
MTATIPVLMGFLLSGCSLVEDLLGISEPTEVESVDTQPNATPSSDNNSLGQGVRSEDGTLQLSLPAGWQRTEGLHRSAQLQAAQQAEDLYTIVLAEDTENLDKFSLENNATIYRRLLIGGLDQFVEETITDVDTVNNNNAVQYVIEGVYEDVPITYLHTTVATQRSYYQIISWTETDRFDGYQEEFQQIASSFREN